MAKRTCSIRGCKKPRRYVATGFCYMHYHRWLRHGDPNIVLPGGQPRRYLCCSIPDCAQPPRGRWCGLHLARWLRHGDPLWEPKRRPEFCTIEGCDKPCSARGWCEMHWTRWRRYGDPNMKRRRCLRLLASHGYVKIYAPGHPEADVWGYAYEHRMKWHDLRGPIPPGGIIHHRNEIKSDNRIRNLRLFASNAEHRRYHRSH